MTPSHTHHRLQPHTYGRSKYISSWSKQYVQMFKTFFGNILVNTLYSIQTSKLVKSGSLVQVHLTQWNKRAGFIEFEGVKSSEKLLTCRSRWRGKHIKLFFNLKKLWCRKIWLFALCGTRSSSASEKKQWNGICLLMWKFLNQHLYL